MGAAVVDVFIVDAMARVCVNAGAHVCVLGKEKSGAWCDTLIHVNICEKTFNLHLHDRK